MPDMSFADAVRSIARLKPLVTSGVLGAAVACSLAVGAFAAERPSGRDAEGVVSVLSAEVDLHKAAAEFYVAGVRTIADANLGLLSPREALLTMKAMARATLEAGPEIALFASTDPGIRADGDPRVVEALARTNDARNGATVVRAFVTRLTREPLLGAGAVSEEARATVSLALLHLKRAGIVVKAEDKPFDGVEAEMKRVVEAKLAVLRKIADAANDPDADPIDLVEEALSGEAEMQPGLRVLLGRLAADALQDDSVSPETKADIVRGMAVRQTADGAFAAIVRQAKEEGADVDVKRMAGTAVLALGTVDQIRGAPAPQGPAPR